MVLLYLEVINRVHLHVFGLCYYLATVNVLRHNIEDYSVENSSCSLICLFGFNIIWVDSSDFWDFRITQLQHMFKNIFFSKYVFSNDEVLKTFATCQRSMDQYRRSELGQTDLRLRRRRRPPRTHTPSISWRM